MRASGLKFQEIYIRLDRPETRKKILRYSPSGRVPALVDGRIQIWDSMAIAEYLAEKVPTLWPQEPHARAVARAICAKMHSGFSGLRSQLSMDLHLKMRVRHLEKATLADINRILEIWKSSLRLSGGPYLFGEFSIADAFYAPVVFRFLSYGIEIRDKKSLKYMDIIQSDPFVREWVAAAKKEKPSFSVFK
jgi:glutathione S-transferase